MCHHRRIAPLLVLFILLACSALPAAAQPGRAAESAAPGLRWSELWQHLMAPFTLLTDNGRGAWDPNGGESDDAVPSSVDDTADGRGAWDPNGNPL